MSIDPIRLFVNELDGKKVAYSSETIFLVQVGHGPKGAYKTRYEIKGSLPKAVMWYNGINIGRGYKKRLVMCGGKPKDVLARAVSFFVPVKGEGWMGKATRGD